MFNGDSGCGGFGGSDLLAKARLGMPPPVLLRVVFLVLAIYKFLKMEKVSREKVR